MIRLPRPPKPQPQHSRMRTEEDEIELTEARLKGPVTAARLKPCGCVYLVRHTWEMLGTFESLALGPPICQSTFCAERHTQVPTMQVATLYQDFFYVGR